MRTTIALTLITSLLVSPASLAAKSAQEQIRESFDRASNIEQLPLSKGVVAFGNYGESVVVTDNPRWVIKGQLFDMWQNKELNSKSDLKKAAQLMPIDRLKISSRPVLELKVNQEKRKVLTIFLDPFEENTPQVVSVLTKYASDYQLRFIFTATSNHSVARLGEFTCALAENTSDELIEKLMTQDFTNEKRICMQTEMMNSYGLSQFLHIDTSPTLIAPNEVFSSGMPEKLIYWLTNNQR